MSRHNRERRKRGRLPLRTPEQHKRFILDNWYHLAAAAWRGYQDEGRGFLNVCVEASPGVPEEQRPKTPKGRAMPGVAYISTRRLAENGMLFPDGDLERLVEKYEPGTEVVVFFHWREETCERQSVYRIVSSPAPKDTVWLGDVGQIKVRD